MRTLSGQALDTPWIRKLEQILHLILAKRLKSKVENSLEHRDLSGYKVVSPFPPTFSDPCLIAFFFLISMSSVPVSSGSLKYLIHMSVDKMMCIFKRALQFMQQKNYSFLPWY